LMLQRAEGDEYELEEEVAEVEESSSSDSE